MQMTEVDGEVTIRYAEPRPTMRRQGVRDGTVLFHGGVLNRDRLRGTAYVFRDGCEPAPYDVSGTFDPNTGQQQFELHGAAPKREPDGCRVTHYSESSDSTTLAFTLIGSDGHTSGEGQADEDDSPYDKGAARDDACRGAGNDAEQEICRDRTLTRLDGELNAAYQAVRRGLDDNGRAILKANQRAWLRDRDACGSDAGCLGRIYRERIDYLENYSEGD
jgi:hypothetical protein